MKIRTTPDNRFQYYCEGCDQYHTFNDTWNFNRDMDNPTISPFLKVTMPRGGNKTDWICHSFIKEGKIQYLNDCSHKLAGCTIELKDVVSYPFHSIKGDE